MKKSTVCLMITLAIGLVGCVTIDPVYRNSLPPSTASAKEIKLAKQGVSEQMKDPSSVQFRNIAGFYRGQPGYTTLCGELNAKNSFGGYTGFRHFTYLGGILVLNEMEDKEPFLENRFNSHWNETCK